MLNNAPAPMMHVVEAPHPGPLKNTVAPLGSKPLPVIVNVNACPALGGLGNVVIVVSVGLELATCRLRLFEILPIGPFSTVTSKLPKLSKAVPLN